MQPTPRGSGVWVGEQKETRARSHAANIRNTPGRATLLPPERKLRNANDHRNLRENRLSRHQSLRFGNNNAAPRPQASCPPSPCWLGPVPAFHPHPLPRGVGCIGFSRCMYVSGLGFSRAVKALNNWASAPAGHFSAPFKNRPDINGLRQREMFQLALSFRAPKEAARFRDSGHPVVK